jgi:hypothetical protein
MITKQKTPDEILDQALAGLEDIPAAAPAPAVADEGDGDDSDFPGLEGEGLEPEDGAGLEGEGLEPEDGAGLEGEGLEPEDGLEPGEGVGEGEGLEPEDGAGLEGEGLEPEDDGLDQEALEAESTVDPEAPVVAFASIEGELEAIASAQGLDNIPEGVTASGDDLVSYLLATGALIEVKVPRISPAQASARAQAFDQAEMFATADEIDEIGQDLTGDQPTDGLEDGEGVGEGEGVEGEAPNDLSLGGDLDLEGLGEPAAAPAAPAAPAKPAVPAKPAAPAAEEAPAAGTAAEGCNTAEASATVVRYHPVADAELIATASAASVQMVAAHTGNNPRWNVIIDGVPACAITWEGVRGATNAQQDAVASFMSDDYRRSTLTVMEKNGVAQVLNDLNAEYFANAFTQSDLAVEIRASVQQEVGSEYQNRVVAMRDTLLDLGNLAVAGMAKGYFKMQNPMHTRALEVLASAGVANAEAVALAIAEALPATFDAAMAKASELLDRSPDFIQQTREAIDEVSPRVRTEATASAAPMTMAHRLGSQAQASAAPVGTAPVQAVATAPHSVDALKSRFSGMIGSLGRRS